MDLFNGFINFYMNGRFFRQRDVAEDSEDPTALTELLVTDSQWYEQHFRSTSKRLTSLPPPQQQPRVPAGPKEQDPR